MIQRIQSIWLLLASLILICVIFFPLLTKSANDTIYSIYTRGLHEQGNGTPKTGDLIEFSVVSLALNIAAAVFCFAAIFLFKNRSMQKKVIFVSMLLIIGISVLCGIAAQQLPGEMNGINVEAGAYFLLLAIVFSLLSIRGIKNDEQLLRSADRLR